MKGTMLGVLPEVVDLAGTTHQRLTERLKPELVNRPQPYGPGGFGIVLGWPRGKGRVRKSGSVLVTVADHDGAWWIHASMQREDRMPSYDDLATLHYAVFGDRWAYQLFAPPEHHVNLHPRCLHLWGLESGEAILPNFGAEGTI